MFKARKRPVLGWCCHHVDGKKLHIQVSFLTGLSVCVKLCLLKNDLGGIFLKNDGGGAAIYLLKKIG